jgi:hypothetical protein
VGIDRHWREAPLIQWPPFQAKVFLEIHQLHAPTPEDAVAKFLGPWSDVLKDGQDVVERCLHEDAQSYMERIARAMKTNWSGDPPARGFYSNWSITLCYLPTRQTFGWATPATGSKR